MHLFGCDSVIKKFKNTTEIIDTFYVERLRLYGERKKNLLNDLKGQMSLLENKVRFLNAVIKDEIIVRKLNKKELIETLTKKKFDKVNDNYNYLINIAIFKITTDEIKKLDDEFTDKKKELNELDKTSIKTLWTNDLNSLEIVMTKMLK
jgi:DNA topoisomerase-2